MSNIPYPPPLSLTTLLKNINLIDENNNKGDKFECSECKWAKNDKEVQKSAFFAKVCLHSSPLECVYMKVNSILQVGPTCGLTALSMVFNGSPNADSLLKKAIRLKYSLNGEMFSAQWLLNLLKENIEESNVLKPNKVRAYIYDGILDTEFIKEKLKMHCMILVPYDADIRNHTPAIENGHRAHWCLVCGFLIDESKNFYIFARNGKSKNLGLFSLKDLSDSNDNLNEFQQPTQHVNSIFLLPECGINGNNGLKRKCIIIEGLLNEVVKVV
ncbi:hypothetical protein PVAND_004636 [Polypedilum vanderplanki]|uniref:Actin maturation protease n=1 Tax=Polypedilum vanderplanki TaxID=319348 RepID=A0A9J6BXR1_POLVA|nr:hypothetical protein PVAND_004636 [Polypedilum vanderplanki]